MAVGLLESRDAFVEMRPATELAGLRRELIHEILREDLRESTDIEDEFLRIERLELSSELRERIDDACRRAAHTGVELGKQPGGTRANDGEVRDVVSDHAIEE